MSNGKKFSYVKYTFFLIILIVCVHFFSSYLFSYVQNKIVSFLNSNRFEYFIIQRVDKFLENISEGELSSQQIDYYSRIFEKLKIKFEPIINRKN